MANRYIPFGYKIENGIICIVENEAALVELAFELYISGKSYSDIAKRFTIIKTPYAEGKDKWNKNMVKRIIENEKYIGNGDYPKIIDEKKFYRANKMRLSKVIVKDEEKNEYDNFIRENSECIICHFPLKRQHQGHPPNRRIAYKCTNPICSAASVDERESELRITKIINRMIDEIDIVEPENEETIKDNEQIEELNNEIHLKIAEGNFKKDEIFKMLYELARLKFNNCTKEDMSEITESIKRELCKYAKIEKPPLPLMRKIVSKILISGDEINIKLKNGKIIKDVITNEQNDRRGNTGN